MHHVKEWTNASTLHSKPFVLKVVREILSKYGTANLAEVLVSERLRTSLEVTQLEGGGPGFIKSGRSGP